jgi:hypothetical protein
MPGRTIGPLAAADLVESANTFVGSCAPTRILADVLQLRMISRKGMSSAGACGVRENRRRRDPNRLSNNT